MEQSVLSALERAIGSQERINLGAMGAVNKLQGLANQVNSDLSSQASNIQSAATSTKNINTAMTAISIVLGVVMALGLGVGVLGASLPSMISPAVNGAMALALAISGGIQIGSGFVQEKLQDAEGQAGLDGASSQILGSVLKTTNGAIKDGCASTAFIGSKIAESIQAYARAQRQY